MWPMSDQKLRELERRWRETGSVEDEAAYLRERVRVGDLTQERLELAAYLGHAAACNALGREPSPAWRIEELPDLVGSDHEISVAFLLALSRIVTASQTGVYFDQLDDRLAAAIRHAEDWLATRAPDAQAQCALDEKEVTNLARDWEGNRFHQDEDILAFGPSPDVARLVLLCLRAISGNRRDLDEAVKIARFEGRRDRQPWEPRVADRLLGVLLDNGG